MVGAERRLRRGEPGALAASFVGAGTLARLPRPTVSFGDMGVGLGETTGRLALAFPRFRRCMWPPPGLVFSSAAPPAALAGVTLRTSTRLPLPLDGDGGGVLMSVVVVVLTPAPPFLRPARP